MIRQREQGFTLIELLVVGVIVCILGTLVAMTYSGVQVKNRNGKRQASIDTIKSHLETYYAAKSRYPTLAELNSANWRKENLKELSENIIHDPQWKKDANCTAADGGAAFVAAPAAKCYAYQATAADGAACNDAVPCAQYSLTATFEGGEKYVKTSLN